MIITLPYPDRRLSPNARVHWSVLGRVKKKARADANTLATLAIPLRVKRALAISEGSIPITVRFYPPDARHRDVDNAIASCKAYFDGIADAISVDDCRFRLTCEFLEPEKPGKVTVEIGI